MRVLNLPSWGYVLLLGAHLVKEGPAFALTAAFPLSLKPLLRPVDCSCPTRRPLPVSCAVADSYRPQNTNHPVNIAVRGNHRLLVEMAKKDRAVLAVRDPAGASAGGQPHSLQPVAATCVSHRFCLLPSRRPLWACLQVAYTLPTAWPRVAYSCSLAAALWACLAGKRPVVMRLLDEFASIVVGHRL